MPAPSFTLNRRIGTAKAKEITTVGNFTEGYRNREDTSLLPPGTLVAGSHDVLVGVSGRIMNRPGFYLDGASSSTVSVTRPLADWEMGTGYIHHLRAGGLTSAGNDGQLQLRWVDTLGVLGGIGVTYWLPLLTALTSTYFQSTNFWDPSVLKAKLLMVNRTANVIEWTGAIGTLKSVTSGTIVLNGSLTLAQLKFDASGYIINDGVVYQYDSISGQTFTLHSGTPNPTGSVVDSAVYQQPVSNAFSGFTFGSITPTPATGFTCDLISVILSSNQVLIASIVNNVVYLSQGGNYKDYDQSAARIQYDGDMYTTIGNVVSFAPQDTEMYISAGVDEWYTTQFTLTPLADPLTAALINYETTQLNRLKTTTQQAAISQYATGKIENDVIYISNEPMVNTLGWVANYLTVPKITNVSYPIYNDMLSYDFTDASVFYWKQRIFVSVPKISTVRIFNMTDPKKPFWEAPQILPVSGFCAVGNTLIGHSYNTFESYIMFEGGSDRAPDSVTSGNPISANATFAFQNLGLRAKRKSLNKFFMEGFISPSTTVSCGLVFRSPGNGLDISQTLTVNINNSIVSSGDDSLGKNPFGKTPFAGDLITSEQTTLPPYFAVVKTTLRTPWLAMQPTFYSQGINQSWELLSYGHNASPTTEMEVDITQ